jgi:hypothetical protein
VPDGCSKEFFEKILELNLYGITYDQAIFGLDAQTQNIALSYPRSMETFDKVIFQTF